MIRQKVWSAILILSLAVLINLAGSVMSQDGDMSGDGDGGDAAPGQPSPEEMQEMMAKWMATIEPGEAHERLQYFVGSWTTTNKVWMGPEPTTTTGTSECELVLGGRYVIDHHQSTVMMPDAETGEMKAFPLKGIGINGYDNYRHLYTSVWIDNMSTAVYISRGSMLPGGKEWNFYGEMDEPMLDVIGRMTRNHLRIVDENTYVFSMYDLHAGPDEKVMEITYKRVTEDDDSE